jgi:hypothetical protein
MMIAILAQHAADLAALALFGGVVATLYAVFFIKPTL